MCRVKGCERPQFVGGLCGFHALTEHYRRSAKPGQGADSRALARIRLLKARTVRQAPA